MKWILGEIGAIEIEYTGCMFSWLRKQSLRALLLLEAFLDGGKVLISMVEWRLTWAEKGSEGKERTRREVVRKQETMNRTGVKRGGGGGGGGGGRGGGGGGGGGEGMKQLTPVVACA